MVNVGNDVALDGTGLLVGVVRSVSVVYRVEGGRKGIGDVQSRVKANLAARRSRRQGLARCVEAGLCRRVVLLVELKGDGVARLCGDICRFEGQGATTNDDPVVLSGASRSRGGSGSEAGHGRRSGGGGGGRGRSCCVSGRGCQEGCELVPRVDGKDHALLAVACLATVHPDRVEVEHLELRRWESGCVICYGITARKDQTQREGKRRGGKEAYKPESKPPGRGEQGCAKLDCDTV
jgi:hypothetical protein